MATPTLIGNENPYTSGTSRYYSFGRGILLQTPGYVAQDGDKVTGFYVSTADDSTGTFYFSLYTNTVDSYASATHVATTTGSASGQSWTELTFNAEVTLVPGQYYWLVFWSTQTMAYIAWSSSGDYGSMYQTSANTYTTYQTDLSVPTFIALTTGNARLAFGMYIVNQYQKETVTFGTPVTEIESHIARFESGYAVSGAVCQYDAFTSAGASVTVAADGTFTANDIVDGQTFGVAFSSDAGSTYSDEYTVTLDDATNWPGY